MGSSTMTVKRLAYLTLIAISISLFAAVSEPSAAGQTPTLAVSEIESLIRSRQYDQALQMTTSALKQQPTNFRIWTLKGIILSMQGKTSDAQHALESALRISPQYPPAMKAEAQLLYLQNDKRAIPLLKQLLKADSNDLTAHEMLAVLERREEKCEDAVAHFEASRDAIDKHAESLE